MLRAIQVVLNEEFRIGACLQSGTAAELAGSPWLLELVAGICEKGESPEASARRESLEEAGLKVDRLVPMHQYLPSPVAAMSLLIFTAGCWKRSRCLGCLV